MNYCINTNSDEYKEMVPLFGEALTYHLWNLNGGNPLDFTPTGENSKLFQTLLDNTGDRVLALKLKAQVYSTPFKEWFGDWQEGLGSKVVDENGEPLVVFHGTPYPKLARGEFFKNLKAIFFSDNTDYIHTELPAKASNIIPAFLNIRTPEDISNTDKRISYKLIAGVSETEIFDPVDHFAEVPDSDGVIGIDYGQQVGKTYVVRESSQVKAVTNTGTFSNETGNIYKAEVKDLSDISANFNNPAVQIALQKYRRGVINDNNNPLVWDIEEEFGITPGANDKWRTLQGDKLQKIINQYTHKRALEIAGAVNRAHKGATAIVSKHPVNPKYYTVTVTVPIGINNFGERYHKVTDFTMVGLAREVRPEDRAKLEKYLNNLSSKDPISFLRQVVRDNPEVFENNPYLQNRVDYILNIKDKLKGLRLGQYGATKPGDDTYMDYHQVRHVIRLNKQSILKLANLEVFVEGLTHEFFHAVTVSALEQPTTESEIQFKQEFEKIYKLVKENSSEDYIKQYKYAFTDPSEFLSMFMSNKEFAESFKPSTIERIKLAIKNFFRFLIGAEVTPWFYDQIHNIVNEFVDKQTNFRAVDQTQYYQPDLAEKKAQAKATESIEEKTRKAYEGRPKDIAKAFTDIAKDFDRKKFDENHEYYHVPSGFYFQPTTAYMATRGFGIEKVSKIVENNEYLVAKGSIEYNGVIYKEGQIFTGIANKFKFKELSSDPEVIPANLDRGARLGTTVHKNLELIANGVVDKIFQDEGFEVTPQAKEDMLRIMKNRFLKKGNIILSEVIVMDPDRGIAGTIDLVVIDKFGRVKLYDFKNREYSKTKSGFKHYESTKFGKSFQQKSRVQLSIYKHMVDKMFKFRAVSEMGIVLLEPVVEDNKIISIDLARQYGDSGIDTFVDNDPAFRGVYGEPPITFNQSTLMERIRMDRDSDSYIGSEEYLNLAAKQSELTRLETLLSSVMRALEARLNIMQARYSLTKRQAYEEFYENLQGASSATAAFISIINYAHANISTRYNEYQEYKKSGRAFTPELLHSWKEYLVAFDQLSELQNLIMDDPTVFSDPDTIAKLDEAIRWKNNLQSVYVSEGKHIIAKWLAPHYNGIKAAYKEKVGRRWRKEVHHIKNDKALTQAQREEAIKKLGTEKEYIDQQIAIEGETLDRQTYDFIYKELTVASRDVNEVTRWLDNMLDTPDPVAAAMVKAFVDQHDKSRVQTLRKRTEFIRVVTEYENTHPRSALMSEEELYSRLLEHDDKGNPTGYLLRPWTREFEVIEKEEIGKLYKQFDQETASRALSTWRKDFMPVNQEEYHDGLEAYLEGFAKGPKPSISKKDIDIIIFNLKDTTSPSIADAAEDGDISETSADLALEWLKYNRWKYSNLKDYTDPKTKKVIKAKNPEWDAFMKELGIPLDIPMFRQMDEVTRSDKPAAKLYNFLLSTVKEADNMLPYSYRLGYRLPGVAKTSYERVRDGQKPSVYMKEEFKSSFFVRPEDVERGESKEFKDELNRPKYFLPIHYAGRLEPQNQSYDLPTIYFKFWETTNDYSNKREILAGMEMTKFFVDTRQTKQIRLFDKIKKLNKGEDDDQGDGAKPTIVSTSNLAAQFNDWFEMAVYGRKSKDSSKIKLTDNLKFDLTKFIDAVNGYTSFNMLALNVAQGVANVGIGETMQSIEAFAGEHMSVKNYTKAHSYYTKWLPSMLGDVGMKEPRHVSSLLIERFDILHENMGDIDFSRRTKMGQLLKPDTLFFVQKAGEHFMQSKFLFGMLLDKKAYDAEGNELGNMLEMYEKGDKEHKRALKEKHGDQWEKHYIPELRLPKEVNLVKSQWTEKDQTAFMRRTKGLLSRMHGEYSDLGRVAIQRMALGRMAYMFRKFVVPGIKRRYGRRQFSTRLDQFVEGNYRTTYNFFTNLLKDLKIFQLSLMSEEWAGLNDHERANIKRTMGELTFLIAAILLATIAYSHKLDDDEEGEIVDMAIMNWIYGFMAYQGYRLRSEILFFTSPGEAMTILRSPMASMSILENSGRLLSSMITPAERYERGPWKGELKLKKNMINMIPIYKQYYKARDIEEQIKWFKN